MKPLFAFLLLAGSATVWAQVTQPGRPAGQVQDAQRRAELRQMLQQKQSAESPHRQLSAQERVELREALRRQRVEQAAALKAANAATKP